jgi:hypothetical protein
VTGRGSCDTGLFRTLAKIATDARAVKSSPGTNFANFVGACTEMTERLHDDRFHEILIYLYLPISELQCPSNTRNNFVSLFHVSVISVHAQTRAIFA